MTKSHEFEEWNSRKFQKEILGWYDRHRRELPWRAAHGNIPDPYHVWLSEIMLQQTTVPAVKNYFEKFTERWPTIHDLAAADFDEVMQAWAGLGYYARARNLLKCAAIVSGELGGQFPDDETSLQALPGIGPYTAAAITSIAFNKEAVVVDGNVERVTARLFRIATPMPQGKKDICAQAPLLYEGVGRRACDLPQALMDLGAGICTPQSPVCTQCPVRSFCRAFASNESGLYPVRAPKKKRPHREGVVYWIETDSGEIVVEKRPENRMLGGMPGLPGSDWDFQNDTASHHFPEHELIKLGEVAHVFTHFSLKLDVLAGKMADGNILLNKNQYLIDRNRIGGLGLPSLYRKVCKVINNA